MVTRGWQREISWEIGVDIHTLLHIKKITNKDLQHNTRNSTQYSGKTIYKRVEIDDRGWDGWMASPTRWTWVWVNSGSWWWTGSPGVLQFMGSQRVGHDRATELNWCICITNLLCCTPETNTTLWINHTPIKNF